MYYLKKGNIMFAQNKKKYFFRRKLFKVLITIVAKVLYICYIPT